MQLVPPGGGGEINPSPPSSDTPDAPRNYSPADATTRRWRAPPLPVPVSALLPSPGDLARIDPASGYNSTPAAASVRLPRPPSPRAPRSLRPDRARSSRRQSKNFPRG